MPVLQRDHAVIAYEVQGVGPPVLLTHGFALTARMWDAQASPLGQGNQIIAWDMRGHGQTRCDATTEYSEEATVTDMLALLDHLEIDRAVIGGLSLGGYMSLAFHRLHPDRTAGLLIIDTGPGYRKDEARAAWNRRAQEWSQSLAQEAAGGRADALALSRAAQGMLVQRGPHVIDSLPGITVPTLILVGSEDVRFLSAAEMMESKIAGSQCIVIEGAGHLSNIDQPVLFNAAVSEFLTRIGWRNPANSAG